MGGHHEDRRFCAGFLALTGLSTITASEVTSQLISLATCKNGYACGLRDGIIHVYMRVLRSLLHPL